MSVTVHSRIDAPLDASLGARLAARVRLDVWGPPTVWVLGGLFTAACLLYVARNIRVADVKGSAQYYPVAEQVISPPPADSSRWRLFVDITRDGASRAAAVCSALGTREGMPRLEVVWVGGAGAPSATACRGLTPPTLDADGRRRAFTAMARASLGLLLVDEGGRYVYGGPGNDSDARVIGLFARGL